MVALCLLLALATAFGCAYSYSRETMWAFTFSNSGREVLLIESQGVVSATYNPTLPEFPFTVDGLWMRSETKPAGWGMPYLPSHNSLIWTHRLGFLAAAPLRTDRPVVSDYTVTAPHWFLLLLFLAPTIRPAARFFKQRSRIRKGRCLSCGYDLRGSPSRCPECGAAAGPASPAAEGGPAGRAARMA